MLTHKDKAFTCEQCFTAFNHSLSLKRHLLNHKGLRPHICDECGVGFKVAFDLRPEEKRVFIVPTVKNHFEIWNI